MLDGISAQGDAGNIGNGVDRSLIGVSAIGHAKDMRLFTRSRGRYPVLRSTKTSREADSFPPQWWYGYFD